MLFNSLQYLVFLPVVFFLYWITPHKLRVPLLLVASYVFYMSWKPIYGLLIFGLTLGNFLLVPYMARSVERKKLWLGIVIAANLITLGIFSMFHGILPFTMEVDQAFIAAILTVIGYSINDTVIVFDRIREYLNTYTKRDKIETINMAINSTLSRTTITSMTTLFVVLVLFIFGGASIKGFAFAILVGILVGTYSSIFIATPVMADLSGDLEAKEVKKKETKKSFSRATQTTR